MLYTKYSFSSQGLRVYLTWPFKLITFSMELARMPLLMLIFWKNIDGLSYQLLITAGTWNKPLGSHWSLLANSPPPLPPAGFQSEPAAELRGPVRMKRQGPWFIPYQGQDSDSLAQSQGPSEWAPLLWLPLSSVTKQVVTTTKLCCASYLSLGFW